MLMSELFDVLFLDKLLAVIFCDGRTDIATAAPKHSILCFCAQTE